MKRICTSNGLSILIEADDCELIAAVECYLSLSSVSPNAPYQAALRLTRELPTSDQDMRARNAELVDESVMDWGQVHQLWHDDGKIVLIAMNNVSLDFSYDCNTAILQVASGCNQTDLLFLVLVAIDFALQRCGQFLLHAAAVKLPRVNQGCIVLFAPSGFGKTTTTLSLVVNGFGLLTDDAVVLNSSSQSMQMQVWGLPRGLKVHRNTANMMKPVKALMGDIWDKDGEQSLAVSKLAKAGFETIDGYCNVKAVILLGERSDVDHQLLAIEKQEALLEVVSDNIRVHQDFGASKRAAQFKAISTLISKVPTFRLNVGTDLNSLAGHISDELILDRFTDLLNRTRRFPDSFGTPEV